jgi:hypothetical protein
MSPASNQHDVKLSQYAGRELFSLLQQEGNGLTSTQLTHDRGEPRILLCSLELIFVQHDDPHPSQLVVLLNGPQLRVRHRRSMNGCKIAGIATAADPANAHQA